MRTKTLLLTAAVIAAGMAASQAQVYSVNAVGYVNKALSVGYSLIANPLNGTNNNLNTIMPTVPDGTFVLKWLPATQSFSDPAQYYDGLGWLPDTATMAPGEGAFINLPSATTVTFVGEVPQGTLTTPISANYSLISSKVPQSAGLSTMGLQGQDGDYVLFWNPATQSFKDPIQYYDGLGWLPEDPTPAVGEGFFFNTPTARNWTRTFNVNN